VPLLPTARFVGAELSESGVAISRKKVPGATFLVADIFQPPAALNAFANWATHAVCSEVLEHVDDPVEFLKQARNYLAAGARLIVTVPGGPISAFDRHIGHRQHFSHKKIAQMLEAAGYRVDRVYRTGFPFFNLYRLVLLARGKRLALDVEAESSGGGSILANFVMKLFGILFRGNLLDSPLGWQLVAVAHKTLS
jgi:SAM-dependent methyltransferase